MISREIETGEDSRCAGIFQAAWSRVVGLVVHDVADPYFSAIAAGAMRVARTHDLMVMVAATFRDPQLELEYLARLRAQRPEPDQIFFEYEQFGHDGF